MDRDRRWVDTLALSRSWVWGLPVLLVVVIAFLQKPLGVGTTFLTLGAIMVVMVSALVLSGLVRRHRARRKHTATAATGEPDADGQVTGSGDTDPMSRDLATGQVTCLRGAKLMGAYLFDADLQGADLQDADLRGARLDGADLQRANLRGAKLGPLPPADP